MRYRTLITGLGGTAADVLAAVRRRREASSPRVRVRAGHGEARVLADDDPGRQRVLELAGELVAAYAGEGRGVRRS